MLGLDLLEGHLAVQLLVAGDVDLAQAPLGVRPQDAEPAPRGGRGAEERRGRVGVGVVAARTGRADVGQAGGQVGVAQVHEPAERGAHRAEVGQALLGVVAVELEVLADQAHEQGMAVGVEVALVEQDPVQGLRLVRDPGAEGGDERIAADEVVLKRQEAEQQVAGGVTKR